MINGDNEGLMVQENVRIPRMVDLEKHQTSIASIQHFLYPWNVVADNIQGGKEYDCNGQGSFYQTALL